MKTERAIELLRRLQDEQFDGIHGDERREALEMAVRALEGDGDMISRNALMKEFSDFVRKSNNSDFAPTPTWNDAVSLVGSMPSAQIATDINVGDTISRQAAIDIVRNRVKRFTTACVLAVTEIEQLPSAQPVNYGSTKSDSSSQLKLNNDLISRQAAIDAINNCYCGGEDSCGEPWIYEDDAIKAVEQLPSAQPERKKGKWIDWGQYAEGQSEHAYCCSECEKQYIGFAGEFNYCPNCGARMDGEAYE